jgi:hypothetical protein
MNIPQVVAIQRYEMVRDELIARFPEQWDVVVSLCSSLPDRIDASTVWRHGRDKPCWSNIKVAMGQRIAADIQLSDDFNSYEAIASTDWEIMLRERGPSWRKNDNFELRGPAVQAFVRRLTRGGLSSYLWRLYAIRNLALALDRNNSVRAMVDGLSRNQGRLSVDEWEKWSKNFANSVGMGWGFVTVYHMLTDLGLTPKPDMWLTLSAVRMGLLEPDARSDLREEDFGRFEHSAVRVVIELSRLIAPTAYPQDPRSALREVDKVMMEWGRQGFARPL